jgi:peptidyl-prolyl cis-trans isomerase A (cyclophilin A)
MTHRRRATLVPPLLLLTCSLCLLPSGVFRAHASALRASAGLVPQAAGSDPQAVFHVRLETTKGDVVLEVTRAWAPHGADRFIDLVRAHYYDDCRLFRVITDRWAQFGIAGDPAVAQAWRTRTIPDDPFVQQSNVRGTIAFAFAVPNGRTTQVFINTRDNSATHDKEPFVVFGRVTQGLDVVDAWYSEYAETSGGGIRAGHQDAAFAGGNAFFDREFPKLDRITRATVEER